MVLKSFIAASITLTASLAAASLAHAAASSCLVGAYRSGATIGAITDAVSDKTPGALRFTEVDGSFGTLIPQADGSYRGMLWTATGQAEFRLTSKGCDSGSLTIGLGDAAPVDWTRIALRQTPTDFQSDGTRLHGMLIEPEARSGTALAVLVHGSENTRAIGAYVFPYLLAAQGVAAFVYDKRGTGASDGSYSQNFEQLAADAVNAESAAAKLAEHRYRRIGFFGASQGGWIAPLAAHKAPVDFVTVAYGLIETPLGEDAEQAADELRRKGYGDDVLAKARETTDATGAVIASHFTTGFDRLEAVKQRYGKEAWFSAFEGEYSGDLLRETSDALRSGGRAKYDNLNIDWHYDAYGSIRSVPVPQLWIMAVNDIDAPSAHSIAQLRQLQHAGKPIDLAIYPDVDHGIREYQVEPDGSRIKTRYAAGYFTLLADWMKGTLQPRYGRATIERSR